MSKKDLARRALAEVYFAGVDITASVRKNFISLTYTDNEEDETDDLQIKLEDTASVWLTKWLNTAVQAAAATPSASQQTETKQYKVTASIGLNVRSGPGTSHGKLGALAYGAMVEVSAIENGWASIKYSGKDAYVSASYIQEVSGGSSDSSGGASWAVGDAVIANGRPQHTSYGEGNPGASVADYRGSVTYLNLKSGVPYPIHVGHLGWFAESQVKKEGDEDAGAGAGADEDDGGTDTKGLSIQAVIMAENWKGDGKDKVLDCGQFELDNVSASGPPAEVTIKCTSLPYNARIRQTKKSKAWEGYTLSGIAKEMASKSGMSCLYESSSDPSYDRVEQITESDIALLSRLCHKAGISLKATNNILVLFDQATYEAKTAVRTIKNGDGSYLKYKMSTGETDTKYDGCRVSYTDPATGKVITATVYAEDYDPEKKSKKKDDEKEEQSLEVVAKVGSVGEAEALAKKSLRLKNKYEYGASFTLPGDPELVAGVTVQLSGWGPWDNKYIVKQAKHTLGGSGYTTQITLRRVLPAESAAPEESAPATSWAVGDTVIATGKPQYSSYGEGTPGKTVTGYRGTITYLNLKDGIPYPIHVGQLGWFAESQVQKEV